MQRFRVWWNSFKTVAIIFSFVLNLVVVIVLLLVIMQIFQIKNGILEPLIDGLHANFVGLDEAVIETQVEVNDQIPVQFDLPLDQTTNVILTEDVPLAASATFTLPGGGGVINGRVDIVLPRDLVLPVKLSMIVPVDTQIPVVLPVDVSIPLRDTQLHEPFDNLRALLEPYVRVIDNLPSRWRDVPDFTIDALQGDGVYLVGPTEDSADPWPIDGDTTADSSASAPDDGQAADADAETSADTDSLAGDAPDRTNEPSPTATFTPFPTITPAQ